MPILKGRLRKEDQDKITRHYTFLLSELDGDFLADFLYQEFVFNDDDKEEISNQASRRSKAELFLDRLLHSGPSQAYGVFLKTLREYYPHVAEKLEGKPQQASAPNTTEPENMAYDEEAMFKIRRVFVQYIAPMSILPIFHSYNRNVLTQEDIEAIAKVPTHNGYFDGARELLNRLVKYKDWYPCLLQVLRDPKVKDSHDFVVRRMWEALEKEPVSLVKSKVLTAAIRLAEMSDFCSEESLKCLKFIQQTFWDYPSYRQVIGDCLAEHSCAKTCMNVLKEELTESNLLDDRIWQIIDNTCRICYNYTDLNKHFAKRLAEAGAVQFMTENLRNQAFIRNIRGERQTLVVKSSILVLHYIAALEVGKTADFKKNETVEVLTSLTKLDNEIIKVHAIVALVMIAGEEDKDNITDTTDFIPKLVKWIKKTLNNKDRRHQGLSLLTLLQSVAKLAVNDQNKPKIVSGALGVLSEVLKLKGPVSHEKTCTAMILQTLAEDPSIRPNIEGDPDFVRALQDLKKSEYEQLMEKVDARAEDDA